LKQINSEFEIIMNPRDATALQHIPTLPPVNEFFKHMSKSEHQNNNLPSQDFNEDILREIPGFNYTNKSQYTLTVTDNGITLTPIPFINDVSETLNYSFKDYDLKTKRNKMERSSMNQGHLRIYKKRDVNTVIYQSKELVFDFFTGRFYSQLKNLIQAKLIVFQQKSLQSSEIPTGKEDEILKLK
jgi:hypothetical protein